MGALVRAPVNANRRGLFRASPSSRGSFYTDGLTHGECFFRTVSLRQRKPELGTDVLAEHLLGALDQQLRRQLTRLGP